jgi:hypothetical protein
MMNHAETAGLLDLMAHQWCLIKEPWLYIALSVCDFLIFLAYMFIGYECFKHKLVKIGSFVFSCGLSHLMALITMYEGGIMYVLQVSTLITTAFLSVIVAFYSPAIALKLSKRKEEK